jgi:alkylation response protein AidB-like acyl-CoA dehydrogenase
MDELLPGPDDPRRLAVRQWIADHPAPTNRELAESGYVAPHWPAPYGIGADPIHQLIIDDEFARAQLARPSNQIGIGWAAPTIIFAGTQEQKDRYVLPALAAEEIWCQLFSEPGAGSDLAGLSTRAVRDGDEWVVNGQKVWTTGAHYSKFGILIARTDPHVAKHKGITYFICPMDLPGIEIRTIRNIAGADSFNEVFFTDARIPHENVVGEVNDGWRLAKVTLGMVPPHSTSLTRHVHWVSRIQFSVSDLLRSTSSTQFLKSFVCELSLLAYAVPSQDQRPAFAKSWRMNTASE